jgi:hypothetical protein
MGAANITDDGEQNRVCALDVVASVSRPARYYTVAKFAGVPDREAWFDVEFATVTDAVEFAKACAERLRQRQGGELVAVTIAPALARPDTFLEGMPESDLEKSLQAHLATIMPKVSWSALVAGAKTPRQMLALALIVGTACLGFDVSFTMPKSIEIPIIGGFLEGKTFDRQTVALWLADPTNFRRRGGRKDESGQRVAPRVATRVGCGPGLDGRTSVPGGREAQFFGGEQLARPLGRTALHGGRDGEAGSREPSGRSCRRGTGDGTPRGRRRFPRGGARPHRFSAAGLRTQNTEPLLARLAAKLPAHHVVLRSS